MPYDLDHVRSFVTVVRAGSFTEAARALGVSQPTITAHVQALESSFGFSLLERSATGAVPTPRGAELARAASAHIDALDDITSLVTTSPEGAQPVHLGGPAELLSVVLMPELARVVEAVGAPIRVTFGLADELVAALGSGSLDVVVSSTRPSGKGITIEPLYDEEFVLVGAPQFAGRELSGIPVIAYAENLPIIRRYWRGEFGERPDGLTVAAVVPDLRAIRDAVVGGAGMSVLPAYLVDAALRSGSLVQLHSPLVAPLNTGYVVTRSLRPSPGATALVGELKRLLGGS